VPAPKFRFIRSGAGVWFGFCRVDPPRQPRRRNAPCQPCPAKPFHPFPADADAVAAQLLVHAVRAVRAAGRGPDLVDVGQQGPVDGVPVARCGGALPPGVVGGHGDVQDPEQECDRELVTVFSDVHGRTS
jgi:hypothetical protein